MVTNLCMVLTLAINLLSDVEFVSIFAVFVLILCSHATC